MVFHPGHYRVALAVNSRAELPPDPEVTTAESEKGPSSISAAIQKIVQVPVLADGLFVHTTRQTEIYMKLTFSFLTLVAPNALCRS
jgi:hypothetical protein